MGTWLLVLSKTFRGKDKKHRVLTATVFCFAAAILFIIGIIGLVDGGKISVVWMVLGAAMLCLRFIPLSQLAEENNDDLS